MPSQIQQFEFLHGSVLTALVRDGKQAVVRLVERPANASWAMYQINDATIYIKAATAGKKQKRDGSSNWQFTFAASEVSAIAAAGSHIVLVCAFSDMKTDDKMWRLFIDYKQFKTMVDCDSPPPQHTFNVKYVPGSRKVDVAYAPKTSVKIAPKALFDWEIPGS